ncbi:hypothetical protein DPMN_174467 [Dreissena polymorpha]|uniref:Uncharacterized protein n=1 Tax=Dreissena polymorpha TaxID=45954 RepID=A0A9D4E757_DREPO|nr:hypothetical protein DPMN_174467 [Dreissena polymorpha]
MPAKFGPDTAICLRLQLRQAALPELSANWFTSPAELTGHQKLCSMTDSEAALNTHPVVSRVSVSLLVRTPIHGIEHLGQTDTFRSLSETELEPRNHSMTDSEAALNTRQVVSRGSVSLQPFTVKLPAKFGPTLLSAFAFNPVRQVYSE